MDFLMFYTALMLILSVYDGVSEGLHLETFDFSHGGSQRDQLRKITDAIEFALPSFAFLLALVHFAPNLGLTSLKIGLLIFMASGMRWLLRDGFQNLITGQPFFYSGTVAWFDRIFKSFGPATIAVLKVLSAVVPFAILLLMAS